MDSTALELAVVGSAVMYEVSRAKLAVLVATHTTSVLFYQRAARRIIDELMKLGKCDAVLLGTKLTPDVQVFLLEAVGTCITEAHAKANVEAWLSKLEDMAIKRKLSNELDIARADVEDGADPSFIIEQLAKPRRAAEIVDAKAAADRWRDWKANQPNEPKLQLPLGLDSGMSRRTGQLWCLAARPGVGKTYFAIQDLIQLGYAGIKSLFITLEMPIHLIVDRAKQLDIRGGFDTLPISFYQAQSPLLDLDKLKAIVWSAWEDGHKVVYIDHFKLVHDPRHGDEYKSMCSVAMELAYLTKGGPCIMLICHINRAGASTEKIGMEHLGGTGRLEEVSDAVMLFTKSSVKLAKARFGKRVDISARQGERGAWTVIGSSSGAGSYG